MARASLASSVEKFADSSVSVDKVSDLIKLDWVQLVKILVVWASLNSMERSLIVNTRYNAFKTGL